MVDVAPMYTTAPSYPQHISRYAPTRQTRFNPFREEPASIAEEPKHVRLSPPTPPPPPPPSRTYPLSDAQIITLYESTQLPMTPPTPLFGPDSMRMPLLQLPVTFCASARRHAKVLSFAGPQGCFPSSSTLEDFLLRVSSRCLLG